MSEKIQFEGFVRNAGKMNNEKYGRITSKEIATLIDKKVRVTVEEIGETQGRGQ